MNRREFMKTVGASGMAVAAPLTLSPKVSANDLSPVGQYFVFAHLGGGWEPTTFCNPKGNALRSTINANARNASSPVNKYPESAIRLASAIYSGDLADLNGDIQYAPYLGTYNETFDDGNTLNDDGSGNLGFTAQHIQQILSGSVSGNTITVASSAGFVWNAAAKSQAAANSVSILEGDVTVIDFTGSGVENEITAFDIAIDGNDDMAASLFMYDAFVCLYADQLRVLNGVDNRTNSHSTGTTYADTGSMAMGYPDFSALYAAVKGSDRPLAWMSDGGGNSDSAGLVARSEATNAGYFDILGDPTGGMTDTFESYLSAATEQRKQLQSVNENLPIRKQLQDQLYLVRENGLEFADIAARINDPIGGSEEDLLKIDIDARNSSRLRHIRVGVAGFATGMASSMQVGFGGFDTHNDHDNRHFPAIRTVLRDLHYLFRSLDVYGVKDQTTVIVGSDFGRTPWYNNNDEGKDHWSVTSYMLFGNHVLGGTQINATNGLVEAKNVDYSTLEPVEDNSGIRMTASHLHRAMRNKAGILNETLALEFPIDAEDLPIFG